MVFSYLLLFSGSGGTCHGLIWSNATHVTHVVSCWLDDGDLALG